MKLKIANAKKIILFVCLAVAVAFAIWFVAFRDKGPEDPQELTLKETGRMGEKKTVQLLVQIAPGGEGRLERGDILLVAPEDKEFSIAEKEGFLIIKMGITEKQSEILTLSMLGEEKGEDGHRIDVKRRKFAVDLAKIGIASDETKGKIISDKVFEDDVLVEKK